MKAIKNALFGSTNLSRRVENWLSSKGMYLEVMSSIWRFCNRLGGHVTDFLGYVTDLEVMYPKNTQK